MKWRTKRFLKRVLFLCLALYVASRYFGFNVGSAVSVVKTVAFDTAEKIIPGSREQFEDIDSQISGAVVKSGAAKTLSDTVTTATEKARAFLGKARIGVNRFASRYGINLDVIFRPRRRVYVGSGTGGSGARSGGYAFDYANVNMAQATALRQKLIDYSMTLRGTPYVLGGETPAQGMDCSSFVRYAAQNGIGVRLPRTAREQYGAVEAISTSEREPGDLVFFRSFGRIDHVGIYLGRYSGSGSLNGREIFINAASEGPRTGVVVSALDEPYWRRHYSSSGRFLPSLQDAADAEMAQSAEAERVESANE